MSPALALKVLIISGGGGGGLKIGAGLVTGVDGNPILASFVSSFLELFISCVPEPKIK